MVPEVSFIGTLYISPSLMHMEDVEVSRDNFALGLKRPSLFAKLWVMSD